MSALSRKTRSRLQTALMWLEALSYAAAVVALLMLWAQMRADSRAERARHSLEFLAQFNAEPLSTHRRNAALPWMALRSQLRSANNAGGLSRREIDALARQVVADYDREHPASPVTLSIEEIVGFYDQLMICAQEDVCEERILRSNFEGFAVDFHCTYAAVIDDLRHTMSRGFGDGLVWFRGDSPCR